MNIPATPPQTADKSHYVVLDGLRGVASLLVVIFHLFEPFSGNDPTRQIINHGYLAVDFFFLLSGFVIAYAYDDRWGSLSSWGFFKRRLIRLQPMVVLGSLIGASLFYLQAGPLFPLIAGTPLWRMVLVMLLGCTLLPLPKAFDIRGWNELHPLNGPAWSLFYEYLANIGYAFVFHKLSLRSLIVVTACAAVFLLHLALSGANRDLIGGWSLDAQGLHIGFARLLYPFLAGMLLMRLGWRIRARHAFALASLLLVAALSIPRLGDTPHHWSNGLYDALCVILIFPLIVAIGAGEKRAQGLTVRIARVFGEISFPLYITHYPLIYVYSAWVADHKVSPQQGAIWGGVLFVAALAIAQASLMFYDRPLRRWLSARFIAGRD